MSDAEEQRAGRERPTEGDAPDADAWATATEEDLAAEQARRRARYGTPPPDPAEELRRLADAVTERIARLPGGLGLGAAPLAAEARARIEPVIERNADVLSHLAAAGQELLAAYRSAVEGHERTWTRVERVDRPGGRPPAAEPSTEPSTEPGTEPAAGTAEGTSAAETGKDAADRAADRDVPDHRDDSSGRNGPHRIDLD